MPGERWEVEFRGDGTVDVDVYRSAGDIRDAAALGPMMAKHAEPAPSSVMVGQTPLINSAVR